MTKCTLAFFILIGCGRTYLQDQIAPGSSQWAPGGTSSSVAASLASAFQSNDGTGGSSPDSGGASADLVRISSTSGGYASLGGSFSDLASSAGGTGGVGATGGWNAMGGSSGGLVSSGGNAGATNVITGATCVMTVSEPSSIQAAIDASPSPGTVCVNAGLYKEDLYLRDGVNLFGTSTDSMICGSVNADAATNLGATLSQLSILRKVTAIGSVRLQLTDVNIQQPALPTCPQSYEESVTITRSSGKGIRFSATRVRVQPWSFVFVLGGSNVVTHDQIQITQSRCSNPYQCWNFLDLTLGIAGAATLPAGSRLDVDVANNLVPNTVLDGMVIQGTTLLLPEDAARSQIVIRHNTMTSDGDLNNGISIRDAPRVPVVLANNVVAYIRNPVYYSDGSQIVQSGNSMSSDNASKAWFESFDSGNFTPSAQSPLVGTADSAYGLDVDIDGHSRQGHFDIGAYQRQ